MKTNIYNKVAENSPSKLEGDDGRRVSTECAYVPKGGEHSALCDGGPKGPRRGEGVCEDRTLTHSTVGSTHSLRFARPSNLEGQLGAAIRKATVLCTLCSVLLLSSCTHDEITAPANGLPQGMRAVTVDIRLPEGKPGFDGQSTDGRVQSTDGRVQSTGTRGIAEVTNSPSKLEGVPVGGGSLSAADFTDSSAFGTLQASVAQSTVLPSSGHGSTFSASSTAFVASNLEEESVTLYSELCTLNSSRAAITSWAEGDELMMSVGVADAEYDLVGVALTLKCDENGTWDVLTDKSYSIIAPGGNQTVKPYTELPLLAEETDLTLSEGLTLMVDEAMGEVATYIVNFVYAPEMEWTFEDTSGGYVPKADASTTAPEMWTANYEYNVATGEKYEPTWSTLTARLRVYTGAKGDVVTLSSVQFRPCNVNLFSNDGTYTATTDADGYAYFYGVMASPVTSGFTLSLTGVAVGEGDAAITCPVSPVTLLEATDLVPVALAVGKSYRLDATAKRPDTDKWAFFSAADITAEAVAAALAEGKSTIYVSGEVTDALKTAIKAQAYDSIDLLVLTDATEIGNNAFYDCIALTSVSAPSATGIEDYAFYSCSALTSVSLPSATEIGSSAFYFCYALESVSLPAATSIGNNAFYNCGALASVTMPVATSIGNSAFQYCSALSSVNLPLATTIGEFAFSSCTALASVNLPLATTIGRGAFNSCTSFTSMYLPAATSIGLGAFQSCDNLTTLTFGAVITEVGTNAFSGIGAVRWTSGCHLTLHIDQQNSTDLKPNEREWAGYTWASITLTGSN